MRVGRLVGWLLLALSALEGCAADEDAEEYSAQCPAEVPGAGDECGRHVECLWRRCSADGAITAECNGGVWEVRVEPCAEISCGCEGVSCGDGEKCGAEQLCRSMGGGSISFDCVANPCGEGVVDRPCACPAVCAPGPGYTCAVQGATVSCGTCPPGGLCP